MSRLLNLFRPKKKHSGACMMSLKDNHEHTDACFVNVVPLLLVEVFNSQGCVSCPPALPSIYKAVLANPNVLLLTYNVTYWDNRSGWKDTFARSQWDQRQKAYASKWMKEGVFTPQVVLNGLADGVGAKEQDMMDIMNRAMEAREHIDVGSVTVTAFGGEVIVASDKAEAEAYDVVVIVYNPNEQVVKIGAGPNKRKKLSHRNVVTEMMKIGEWAGGNAVMSLPAMGGNLERVVVVQAGAGGPIVAAAKV